MSVPRPLRYFAAISPPAAPLVAVLAILPVGAAALEAIDRGASDWVLASIGLVQLFAASTGFSRHASRGYYDPVLLGTSRVATALAHFAVSAAPGVISWTACGFVQSVAARSLSVAPFRTAGWASILLMSAIPWAVSARSAPYLGGTLWVIVSASLLVSGKLLVPLARLQSGAAWAGDHPATAFAVGLSFPLVIPSFRWPPAVLAVFFVVSFASVALAAAAIAAADYPLVERGA